MKIKTKIKKIKITFLKNTENDRLEKNIPQKKKKKEKKKRNSPHQKRPPK